MTQSNEIIIYGVPQSTYVRTARMALEAKGVPYTMEPLLFGTPEQQAQIRQNATFRGEPVVMGSPAHRAMHPFCKVPVLEHGEVTLFESWAITSYIDEVFAGRPLQPADAVERARMRQWIGVVSDYLFPVLVRRLAGRQNADAPPPPELTQDTYVPFAKPSQAYTLQVLDQGLAGKRHLVGEQDTLADYFLLPILSYLAQPPEGQALVASLGNLSAWYERIASTPEARATQPPPMPQ